MLVLYYQKHLHDFQSLYDWQIFFRAKKPIRSSEKVYNHTFWIEKNVWKMFKLCSTAMFKRFWMQSTILLVCYKFKYYYLEHCCLQGLSVVICLMRLLGFIDRRAGSLLFAAFSAAFSDAFSLLRESLVMFN